MYTPALFEAKPVSKHQSAVARGLARRGANRLGRRWATGLVPIVGIAYAGYDARRTIDRVLLRPTEQSDGRAAVASR